MESVERADEEKETSAPERSAAPGEEPSPGPARHLFLPHLVRNLRCGVRLSAFLPAQPEEFAASPSTLAVLVLADIVGNLISSYLLVGRGGSFAYASLPSFLFHLPVMLLCGMAAAKLLGDRLLVGLPVALVSLSIPLELYHCALEGLSRLSPLRWLQDYLDAFNYYRFFWWWCAAALLFLLRIHAPLRRRLAGAGLFLVLVVLPLWAFPRGDLWTGPSGGSESGELHLTDEVLNAQPRLLDQQLAALLPGTKKVPHLYFVGFAGDATQDVFTREVSAVEQLFAARFGTAGRSIVLANNPRTATTLPFATAGNLERTLKRVGEVMNRDSDVLFLFITSHGSPDHVLTVDNSPLELDELTPEMLRRMLERSGIEWKVLVVSACYSGGFIEPLKDEETLIMTAADATRESFGCGFGEKFTWFGEALLNEALRSTYSFPAAFEAARQTIRKWEDEQGETPSNPQIFQGSRIGPVLQRVERSLTHQRGEAQPRPREDRKGEDIRDADGA